MLTGPKINRRSNATNAYDLMTDIAAYILEEPKRIWMGFWMVQGNEAIRDALDKTGPACGTVGCIAGNTCLLTGRIPRSQHNVWPRATQILSGKNGELESDLDTLFLDTKVPARYGTKRYAQIVASRIREFQYDHEADLRAIKIRSA